MFYLDETGNSGQVDSPVPNDGGQPVLYFPPLDSGLVSLMSQLANISDKASPQTKANSGAEAAAGVAQSAAPMAQAAAVVALAAGGNGRC